MSKINLALVGVGNCSSALVQAISYYGHSKKRLPTGLMTEKVGRYSVKDMNFVAAIDVDHNKIGKDLSKAIFQSPNNTPKFSSVTETGVTVENGPLLDGLGSYAKEKIPIAQTKTVNVQQLLRKKEVDILINLLPSGANKATKYYAKEALAAKCSFINATPSRLASDKMWQRKFRTAKLQLVGDDIKDQIGSTVLHETILNTLSRRGVKFDESYQLDVGGGMESFSALEKDRYSSKRKSKLTALGSAVSYEFPLVAGSSDYVEFMGNSRTSHFWIKGNYLGKSKFTLDMTLNFIEGPSCASVLIDVIRAVKLAKDKKIVGGPKEICSYAFKMPPDPMPLDEAAKLFQKFSTGRN
ncbi:inositol-3-phosphate synthase [[Eubacterium] cellulosolvens]